MLLQLPSWPHPVHAQNCVASLEWPLLNLPLAPVCHLNCVGVLFTRVPSRLTCFHFSGIKQIELSTPIKHRAGPHLLHTPSTSTRVLHLNRLGTLVTTKTERPQRRPYCSRPWHLDGQVTAHTGRGGTHAVLTPTAWVLTGMWERGNLQLQALASHPPFTTLRPGQSPSER